MSESARFDWTGKIIEKGFLVYESDVEVVCSITEDGAATVFVDEITLLETFGKDRLNIGESDRAYCAALYREIKEALEADGEFIAKAHKVAGLVYVGLGGNDPDGHFRQAAE